VDGDSTDNTIEIISRFQDDRLKLIVGKDNGVYDAMNKGISIINGDWLYFLGSDDRLKDEFVLEDINKYILKFKPKFLYGNVNVIGDTDWAKDGDIYDGEFSKMKIFQKNICHQAIFYHKQLFHRLGKFNINYKICADWDMNLRCFANFKPYYINRIVANFYGGNTSSSNNKDHVFGADIWKNILKYFLRNPGYYNLLWKYRKLILKSYIKI